jgi:hypothetical protein
MLQMLDDDPCIPTMQDWPTVNPVNPLPTTSLWGASTVRNGKPEPV